MSIEIAEHEGQFAGVEGVQAAQCPPPDSRDRRDRDKRARRARSACAPGARRSSHRAHRASSRDALLQIGARIEPQEFVGEIAVALADGALVFGGARGRRAAQRMRSERISPLLKPASNGTCACSPCRTCRRADRAGPGHRWPRTARSRSRGAASVSVCRIHRAQRGDDRAHAQPLASARAGLLRRTARRSCARFSSGVETM